LAYVVWQLAETALERGLGEGAAGATPNARARTLRPLLRKFVLGVLAVVWVMIALSAVGIDIGPLLAGAGVVGIALGFGAQTLVRDVVSGVFFLIDDAFRVGEYIEAGTLKGTVEGISIRSLRLRHHRGAVHTVPYGELRR
jgi:small-conductance mechanosensitive channel